MRGCRCPGERGSTSAKDSGPMSTLSATKCLQSSSIVAEFSDSHSLYSCLFNLHFDFLNLTPSYFDCTGFLILTFYWNARFWLYVFKWILCINIFIQLRECQWATLYATTTSHQYWKRGTKDQLRTRQRGQYRPTSKTTHHLLSDFDLDLKKSH